MEGHGPEWGRVFHIGSDDRRLLWEAIVESTSGSTIRVVRDRFPFGVTCGIESHLRINRRSALVTISRHYAHEGAAARLVTAYPSFQHGDGMAIAHKITSLDIVELTEHVDDAPAGARGGVLELYAPEVAMVERLEPKLDAAARIVFVPLDKLRVIRRAKDS